MTPAFAQASAATVAAAMSPARQAQTRARIADTSKKFEGAFLSSMLQEAFKDVDLGGGQGGEAFKSIMMDAIGKEIVQKGGIGLASQVQAEMLKLQGLS